MNKGMIDIETLSTSHEAAVCSVGLVIFDETNIISELEIFFDLRLMPGHRDEDTIAWWMQQDSLIRTRNWSGTTLPAEGLRKINNFLNKYSIREMWANSPTFDCTIMRSLYKTHRIDPVWSFRIERDFRTLIDVGRKMGVNISRNNDKPHDALSDARDQARLVQLIQSSLKG